jgi:hypothetical protein
MKLHEILIPVKSNSGRKFTREHNRIFSDYVVASAGGLSQGAPLAGQWRDNGKIYRESMRPLRIACDARTMAKIARKAREHYRQLSIMYYTVSNEVTFCND